MHDGARREAVDAEGKEDQPRRFCEIRAEQVRQCEVADTDRDEHRPEDESDAGQSILQPAGGPAEVSDVSHHGAGDRDQSELSDDQPVRGNPMEPAP